LNRTVSEDGCRVAGLEQQGHPLEGGCPIRKGEKSGGHKDHQLAQNLALAEGVGELLGHCGRGCSGGEGDNQSDGEEDLLQWCVSDLVAASG
jgi:hypothetical protein